MVGVRNILAKKHGRNFYILILILKLETARPPGELKHLGMVVIQRSGEVCCSSDHGVK